MCSHVTSGSRTPQYSEQQARTTASSEKLLQNPLCNFFRHPEAHSKATKHLHSWQSKPDLQRDLAGNATWVSNIHKNLKCTDTSYSSFCSNASPFSSTCFWEWCTYQKAILKQAILWSRIKMNRASPLTNAGRQVCWHFATKQLWKLAQ